MSRMHSRRKGRAAGRPAARAHLLDLILVHGRSVAGCRRLAPLGPVCAAPSSSDLARRYGDSTSLGWRAGCSRKHCRRRR